MGLPSLGRPAAACSCAPARGSGIRWCGFADAPRDVRAGPQNTQILAFSRSNAYNDLVATRRVKLSDQVRRAVDASGLSRYRISKELGVAESTMSRFMSGQGGLLLANLDTLADLLDLNITAPRRSMKG